MGREVLNGFSSLYAMIATTKFIEILFCMNKCFIEQTTNEGLLDAKNGQQ